MKHSKILILLALLCSALPAAAAPKDDLRQVQRAIGESNRKLQQQQSEQRQLQSNIRQTQSELDTVRRLVIEEMESAYSMRVPLLAECGSGTNWLEAH